MPKLKNKYNRVGSDSSQLQKFADEVCDNFSNEEGKWIDPSKGGGTQIYEHILTVEIGNLPEHEGEPQATTVIIRNTSAEALKNKKTDEWLTTGHFLSGLVDLTPGSEYRNFHPILLITQESEPNIYVLDFYGSPLQVYPTGFASAEEIIPL